MALDDALDGSRGMMFTLTLSAEDARMLNYYLVRSVMVTDFHLDVPTVINLVEEEALAGNELGIRANVVRLNVHRTISEWLNGVR